MISELIYFERVRTRFPFLSFPVQNQKDVYLPPVLQ